MAREVPLKKFDKVASPDIPGYRDMLRVVIQQPLEQGGMQYDEMRDSVAVEGELANANGDTLTLEDHHFDLLKRKLENMRWAMAHSEIVQFIDDVKNAPKAKLNS